MSDIYQYIVAGRVQGVGFRAAARDVAGEHGLAGWVANRADGTVELQASGADTALDALADWLRTGPPGARVDDVARHTLADAGELPKPFTIR